MRSATPPVLLTPKVWLLTLCCSPMTMFPVCMKGKGAPPNIPPPLQSPMNERQQASTIPPPVLTFNRYYMLSDLVLQRQVIDALDQVVDCVNVGVDRLEPMDLCPDGRWVGQNKLRACWAGLGSLARNRPRAELTGPWARRRSGSELGRDGLGHRDGNWSRDRAWSGHGWLRLLRETRHGHWDARLEIHLGSERLTLFFFFFPPPFHNRDTNITRQN